MRILNNRLRFIAFLLGLIALLALIITVGIQFNKLSDLQEKLDKTTKNSLDSATNLERIPMLDDRVMGYLSDRDDMLLANLNFDYVNNSQSSAFDKQNQKELETAFSNSDRQAIAALDVDWTPKKIACHFDCQIGINISKENTPRLWILVNRVADSVNQAFQNAVKSGKLDKKVSLPTNEGFKLCRPDLEKSFPEIQYPSLSAAKAYVVGLVLAKIDPSDRDKILYRANELAHSSLICNETWDSGLINAQSFATNIYSYLQNSIDYSADEALAKNEFATQILIAEGMKKKVELDSKIEPHGFLNSENSTFIESINKRILNIDCDKVDKILEKSASENVKILR